jgi:hypothetical protein
MCVTPHAHRRSEIDGYHETDDYPDTPLLAAGFFAGLSRYFFAGTSNVAFPTHRAK